MDDDSLLPFALPAVQRKKVSAAFDGGRLSSDAGVLLLRMFAIAAGYEDANDCDTMRNDPVFKMAVGHLPETGITDGIAMTRNYGGNYGGWNYGELR